MMNRKRAHAEVPVQVSFSGRPSEHVRVCTDEGQILPLAALLTVDVSETGKPIFASPVYGSG